jgi:hypothetical protein
MSRIYLEHWSDKGGKGHRANSNLSGDILIGDKEEKRVAVNFNVFYDCLLNSYTINLSCPTDIHICKYITKEAK